MNRQAFDALVAQYKTHGWSLQRVLLTSADAELNAHVINVYQDIVVETTDIAAAWFSRRSKPSQETWELRVLDPPPFALNAFLDDDISAETKEFILRDTERRMRASRPGAIAN
jgi:hypothetical protein